MGLITKKERWLRGNSRAVRILAILPLAGATIGLSVAAGLLPISVPLPLRILAAALFAVGLLALATLVAAAWFPRVAYADGQLFLYLRPVPPCRVPIEFVECFLQGEGPVQAGWQAADDLDVRNVAIRIAERAKDWQQVEIHSAIGHWCGGYITIRGTWCEPINARLLATLNEKLVAAKKRQRRATEIDSRPGESPTDRMLPGTGELGD
jgi:hypothetical protein